MQSINNYRKLLEEIMDPEFDTDCFVPIPEPENDA